MEIRESSLAFDRTEGEGPQTASVQLAFARSVTTVAAGITGYAAVFEDEEDHHLGRLEIELSAAVDAGDDTLVNVTGRLGLRDWSNDWDDPYSGVVDVAVLADLVPAPVPGPGDPRGDLIITGAETTQVIQHFRSGEHLDAANVFPDNSIRLIGGKPSLVRLYPDYDAFSGLAPIANLSGELVVESGGTTTTLAALESIVPRRDGSTERANRRHTVNFILPEAICQGTVTLRAMVFDAADTTQFSRTFERELQFENKQDLPVLAVGIKYTGPDTVDGATDADLAAPLETDFLDTLVLTEKLFPIPGVLITSYVEMEYDGETVSDIDEGCDKIGDLRDAVADLRGDSDDLVYGLYNVGVDTGSVGGCGGGGAGVGRIGSQGTAAHELGHALGRKHAPCDNVTRCAQPLDTDGDYPRYSGYDSDSIGEFGADPSSALGSILNPAVAHDIMGYSPSKWISPYTYKALMTAVPVASSGGSPVSRRAARDDDEWIRIKQPRLFLRLDVDRGGAVRLQHAFHFDALPRSVGSIATDLSVVFLDCDGHELSSACLFAEGSGCGCSCDDAATVRIRQAVPFPAGAKTMLLVRCGENVESWPIGHPPRVGVTCTHAGAAVTVRWTITEAGTHAFAGEVEYWSLVQWRDRSGTWRGCAPRTQDRELVIPTSVFRSTREIALRVLVSSGIATGVGECRVRRGGPPPRGTGAPRVVLTGRELTGPRTELPAELRAGVVEGRPDAGGRLRWFSQDGGELARGRSLDLRALPLGQTVVSARVLGASDRVRPGQWLVERTADGRFFLLTGDQGADACDPSPGDDARDGSDHDHDEPRHRSTSHTHDEIED